MIRTLQSISVLFLLTFIFFSCGDQSTQVEDDPINEFSHTQNPGASNEAFITNDEFDELVVEVQYMPGVEPDQESLNNLQEYLEQHLEKTSITVLTPEEIPSGDQETYTADQVRDLEDEHRKRFTEDGTLVSYAIFLDGEYDDGNVLGIAYYNTSTAYFGETIEQISGGATQPSREKIESTVFNHEFGHLIGLVNSGTDAQDENHHDSENGAHCTVEECLMYYSVNTTNFFANLFDGSVPELDEFCLADIEAVK
ncbi:MAG: hypothetical protein WEA58_07020 [Balneolaceae bacterium]